VHGKDYRQKGDKLDPGMDERANDGMAILDEERRGKGYERARERECGRAISRERKKRNSDTGRMPPVEWVMMTEGRQTVRPTP
jgi:hypothetical protein